MTKSRRNTMRSVFFTLLALLLCAGMTSVAFAAGGGGSSWVSFDPNDGSGYMNSISYSGDSWLQPESEFTNAGFSFVGWSTSPDGPVQYLPGDVAYRDDPGMPDSGTPVMYAIWGDMSAEQLAGSYTPRVREPYSYDLSTARDDETGVVYLTAELSWDKSDDINAVTIGLNLGTPDGPRVPSLATTFSKDDGSITRSYWTDEATVAIPYVPDGEEQVTANGAVNGILPGDVIYATVAGRFGEASCPGNPICFVAKTYSTGGNVEDNVGWLAENGLATVTRDGWTTKIELLDDAVLPEGGLTLDDGAYHLVTNAHTLTGTLTNRWGELYVEHMTADGKVLAGYATSPQTVAFSGYGYSSGNLFGAVSVTLKNYGHFSYDSAYMNATVTNGTQIGTQDVQGWGYVNTASLDEYEKTPLTEDQLTAYTPKNVTVTPQEDGLIVECDYEPEATQININVDVILSDGNPARLISDSSSSSSKDQVMSLEGNRQPFFLGGLRRLSDEEEQEVSEDGEQKYVNGFHGGDRLSVTMSFKIGPQMQETPWSSPAVTFTYTSSVIGATFAQGGGTVARNFLPDIATMTVTSPLDVTYMGQPVFLDYTLALNDGTPLVLGTDYTEEYINNFGIGEATLAVIGMGNYSGRMTQDFTISPIPLADVNVTLAFDSTVYNGRSQEPVVLVSYDGMILSKSGGFYAEYANNVNAGTATVTLTPGYNNICEGTRVVEFTILPRSMETGAVCATLSQNRFEWIGAEGTYEPTVTTVKWGETALTEDTDYTVSYENNTATGTAYAVLTGINNYEGVYRIPFTIFETANLAIAVTIDPLAPEIYTGSAVEPEVTVRDGQKILTKGWDYSVAYSNNVNAGEATVTVTGRRDYTGQVTVPFIIDPADLGLLAAEGKLTMALEDAVYTFSGGENKPQAELTLADDDEYDWNDTTLIEGTSYTLSYDNNIEAGTAVAIATGMGNYGGMCAAEFTINPQNLNDLYYSPSVATVAYNGQARTPAISMHTTYLDENRYTQYYYLTENVDYTVDSWANNVNAGTATVTVTGMGNNFTGTRAIDFTINPLEMRQNDYDLTAIATRVGEDGAELHYLTVTWKQNGRSLVEGTDFTVEGLYSYGDEASFYIQWIGNFTTSTGSISIPLTDNIGSLPASGNSGSLNWEISANGVMTISGAGSLSKLSSWSSYAGLVKKIVVQRSASYGNNPITSITAGTFEDFINCTECTLPEGMLTVSPDAFPKNNRMVVHLPDTVTTIDFSYSSNFEFVKALVNPGSTTEATIRNSENYYAYFGYEGYPDFQLLDTHSEDRGLCLVKYSGNGGIVTIPDFVDTIEAYGFERNGIEKVIIPGSVKRVNSFLQNCYDLRELVIQPGNLLTELPSHLISGCDNITLYIPDNITTMPSPLNYYSDSNMLIVANCDSSAIAWAKSQTSWGSPVWAEETARTYGPRYRMLHRNPTVHPGQAPTCDTAGWTEYVTCTACNCSTRVDLPALGHSWDAVTYTWNNDHTQVTATRVCKHNAAHMETETVTVTSKITIPATCISTGERAYTSKVFSNPVFRLQKYAEVLPVSGHSWRAEPSRAATGSTDGIRGGAICGICGEEKSQQTVSAQKVMQIPTMTRTIEAEAFMGVVAEQITVPNGVTTIGDRAFADCDDLLLVVIPGGNTTMEGDPFAGSDVAVICPDGSAVAIWCDAHDIAHNP